MKRELEEAWALAAKTGEPVDIKDWVVCDDCATDYTESDAEGGMLFQSKAICPACTPKWEAGAKRYGEERFIRARAEPGERFRDFTLRMRGGNNTVRVGPL